MPKRLKTKFKIWFKKYFDYKIVGEYYDFWIDENDVPHYEHKYNRRYYLKCLKKKEK